MMFVRRESLNEQMCPIKIEKCKQTLYLIMFLSFVR
jgi:hypothetical protein